MLFERDKNKNYLVMKASKYLLILLGAGLLLSGCTREYITEEYITYQGMDMKLVDFEVKENNWTACSVEYGAADQGYFKAELKIPEITQKVVDKGAVLVYKLLDNSVWTPLPAMRTVIDANNNTYTTFTDFEWTKGLVTIFFTASDLYIGDDKDLINPGNMTFRVAIQL